MYRPNTASNDDFFDHYTQALIDICCVIVSASATDLTQLPSWARGILQYRYIHIYTVHIQDIRYSGIVALFWTSTPVMDQWKYM